MAPRTLTQEYFLCSIGQKGKYSSMDMEKGVCLVAAGLLELLMEDVIVLHDGKFTCIAALPADRQPLAVLYAYIQSKQPVKAEKVLEAFSFTLTDKNLRALMQGVGESLARTGGAKKARGLFGGARYLPDPAEKDRAVQRIRAELLEDGPLTDDVVALTALLHKSGDLKRYFSPYEKKALKDRLKEIKNTTENQLVSQMVEYIELLFSMIVIAAS